MPSGFVTYPKHMEKSPSGQAVAAEPCLIKKGFYDGLIFHRVMKGF